MTYVVSLPRDLAPFERRKSPRKASFQTVFGAFCLTACTVTGAWILVARPGFPPDGDQPLAPRAVEASSGASGTTAGRSLGALLDPRFSLGVAPQTLGRGTPLGSAFEPPAPTVFAQAGEPDTALQAPIAPELDTDASAAAPAPAAQPVVAARRPLGVPVETAAPTVVASVEEPGIALPAAATPPLVESMPEAVPLPLPRPVDAGRARPGQGALRPAPRQMAQSRTPVPQAPAQDNRTFFQKLFGLQQPPPGTAIAYAAPEAGSFGNSLGMASSWGSRADVGGGGTAVYDISAHTVYMPNGQTLEAHSGLGEMLDDPRRVNARNRGPTPPQTYDLQPRAELFHGVRALRLNPVGGGGVFGRNGLLAHSFMLGPNGDSNGCVSFRNYSAFLQAYESGEVKRLVVVARRT